MTFILGKRDETLASAIAHRVTDRDRQIATDLYEHRVLTARQFYELHFDSLDRAQDRLTQLQQLQVVDRFRPYRRHGSHPYHYVLGPSGALLLSSERGIDPDDLDYSQTRRLRLLASQQLRHQVEANGIITRLAHALRSLPGAALIEWRGQRRCTRSWGELVRPDSHLRLQLPNGPLEAWLEHDRGTETQRRLQDKLDRYDELALAIEQPITLLLTLLADRREQETRRALQPTSDVLLLTTTVERHQADPLTANWLPAASQTRIALSDLPAR